MTRLGTARPRAADPCPPPRHHGARADRRSRDRRLGRGRGQPQLLARSAATASPCRAGRWRRRARSTRRSIATSTTMACAIPPSRSRRARWSPPGRTQADRADRRQGRGHGRRPDRLRADRRRDRRDQPRRPDAGAEEGAAGGRAAARRRRPKWKSGWSAAATSKARSSRAAGSASKGSTSSWSTRPARSSRPRAPISTASSCSNASPTAATRSRVTQGFGGGRARSSTELGVRARGQRRTSRSSGSARSTVAPAAGCSRRRPAEPAAPYDRHSKLTGAVEKTRTSTAFRPQRPQRCASTSSATTARHEKGRLESRRHWQGAASSKGP